MLLLTSTNDKITLTTSNNTTITLDVHASYVDYNSGVISPSRTNSLITSSTTTNIVTSPSNGVQRNVKSIFVRNRHTDYDIVVSINHTDGTNSSLLYQGNLGPQQSIQYVDGFGFSEMSNISQTPSWYGNLYAAYGRCDPQQLLRMATMAGTAAATPTNITASIARIAYFRPPADITVNKVRYYGVGVTTNIYRIAIYNSDTLARLTAETAFTTAANTWGEIFSSLNLTLTKDQSYFIACSVNTTGTTPGLLCMAPTVSGTTGTMAALPRLWPGNLNIGQAMDGGFAQFAVTTGALPDPAATIAVQSNWTGGMPLFFLDNSNA